MSRYDFYATLNCGCADGRNIRDLDNDRREAQRERARERAGHRPTSDADPDNLRYFIDDRQVSRFEYHRTYDEFKLTNDILPDRPGRWLMIDGTFFEIR